MMPSHYQKTNPIRTQFAGIRTQYKPNFEENKAKTNPISDVKNELTNAKTALILRNGKSQLIKN
jgi:hypothetical protein